MPAKFESLTDAPHALHDLVCVRQILDIELADDLALVLGRAQHRPDRLRSTELLAVGEVRQILLKELVRIHKTLVVSHNNKFL